MDITVKVMITVSHLKERLSPTQTHDSIPLFSIARCVFFEPVATQSALLYCIHPFMHTFTHRVAVSAMQSAVSWLG